MSGVNVYAILAAAMVCLLIGAAWYSPMLLGGTYLQLRGLAATPTSTFVLGEIIGEFIRWLIIVSVIAVLFSKLEVKSLSVALLYGLMLWIAFYTALAGSVLHEGYSWKVYAIHAGDGLLKLMAISSILGLWRNRA